MTGADDRDHPTHPQEADEAREASEALDPAEAAALLTSTTRQTRRSLQVRGGAMYAGWGLAWLVGLGAMWWSVRDQQPYTGPSAGAGSLLGMLLVAAAVVTTVVIGRAARGVHGVSENQGRMLGATWAFGFVTLFSIEGALARQGAPAPVLGVLGTTGPLLLTSVIYLAGSAIWLDRIMFVAGVWLAAVTVAAAWSGPVTGLLVASLAGGGGLLVVAGHVTRSGQP